MQTKVTKTWLLHEVQLQACPNHFNPKGPLPFHLVPPHIPLHCWTIPHAQLCHISPLPLPLVSCVSPHLEGHVPPCWLTPSGCPHGRTQQVVSNTYKAKEKPEWSEASWNTLGTESLLVLHQLGAVPPCNSKADKRTALSHCHASTWQLEKWIFLWKWFFFFFFLKHPLGMNIGKCM